MYIFYLKIVFDMIFIKDEISNTYIFDVVIIAVYNIKYKKIICLNKKINRFWNFFK